MREQVLFGDKISYLFSDAFESTDINELLQPEKLDSKTMNSFLDYMETNIETLYEKSRVLEEVLDEVEMHLATTVADSQNLIFKSLDVLESDRDSIKQKLYSEVAVDFSGASTGRDRNNEPLPMCEIFNSHITSSGKKVNDLLMNDVNLDSSSEPYKNNISDLIAGKPYRTFYALDSKPEGGVTEKITCSLDTPSSFNFLLCELSNCELEEIEYNNEDGSTTKDASIYSVYKSNRVIDSLKLSIKLDKAIEKMYEIDRSRMDSDFWAIVNDDSYNSYITGKASSLDIEKYSGMAQYRSDLKKYESALSSWNSEKAAIDAYNSSAMSSYYAASSRWENSYG